MAPASKGTAAKQTPASRRAPATKPGPTKKPAVTKKVTGRSTGAAKKPNRVASTVKKAVKTAKRVVSATKAAPPAKKAAPAAKKAAVVAKKGTPAAKKAAPTAAKAAPAAKKAAAAPKKAAPAVAAVPARTTFTPKPKPPPPVRPKTGPYAKDTKFLEEVTELLIADRAIYQEQATSLRAEADSLALEREPGDVQFDEESGEGGTVTVDRERNLALSGQALLAVEEIDFALERIADKTYGYCERCFQPIPKPRLRALPHARLCVACKSGGLSRR